MVITLELKLVVGLSNCAIKDGPITSRPTT